MFPRAAAAYDRAITVFSPDGRLLQVEYAVTATRRTPLALGARCKEGVVLVAKRSSSPLVSYPEKVSKIDDHLGAIAAGIFGDGLILIDRSRLEAQSHRLIYNEPITLRTLAKKMALFEQSYTQYAGVRPFGVVMMFSGVDDQPGLYVTHPGGAYYSYLAIAVGMNSDGANEFLTKNYREDFTLDEAIEMVVGQLVSAGDEKIGVGDVEGGIVPVSTKRFRPLSEEEISQVLDVVYKKREQEKGT